MRVLAVNECTNVYRQCDANFCLTQSNANNENETSSNALLNFEEFETTTGSRLMLVVHLWFNPNYFREISLHYEDQVAKFK